MLHFFIIILNIIQCSSDHAAVEAQNHVKVVEAGESVTFTCVFEKGLRTSVAWVKQRVGEKPLVIVSSYQALEEKFENNFDQDNRFNVTKDGTSFNLSITNTKESDTATYYCIQFAYVFTFGNSTALIVKAGSVSLDSADPVSPSDSAALQCSVLTPHCAGGHNVYWFRQQSGESAPGMIYTQERRNAQCERSSQLNSTEHKCFYSLPRRNSSEPGLYYCAVAACGQILFGEARNVDLTGKCFEIHWTIATLVITTLSVIVIMILSARLYKHHQKDVMHIPQHSQLMAEDADALNYAALNFQQKRRTGEQNLQDNT